MNFTYEKIRLILEANRVISSTLNTPELLRRVMKLATEVVEAETSSILLYDKRSDELYFDLAIGENETELKQVRLKSGEGIAGWVARNRQTQVINDVASDPRWTKRTDTRINFSTRSIIAVPLICKQNLFGVVEAINKRSGTFTKEDAEMLEAFAAQAAVSIENARIFGSLEEEKEKIEAVFSQMSDGAVFADENGNKLLANAAAVQLLGKENVSRQSVFEIFRGFSFKPEITEILSSADETVPFESLRTESKTLYLNGTANKTHNASGSVIGSIFVFRDTTAEKKENLLKRNFIALISHKLKTPLVAITGYGPLLLDDPTLGDFQKNAVSSITKQGKYLLGLVEKLLYFTLVDEERIELTKTEGEFQQVVNCAAASLKDYLAERQAQVAVMEDVKGLPCVRMDVNKIETAVKNLIENAVKFNPSKDKKVEIGVLKSPGFAGIYVKDNGCGIPPEEREKVFNKFYQVEESFTGQVEGAGLGLALVKNIIEAHGGKVELESGIGAGSTFKLMLPV